jgi:hypothetical protein
MLTGIAAIASSVMDKEDSRYHLFVYGVPWAFDYKDEAGTSFGLRLETTGDTIRGQFFVEADDGSLHRGFSGCKYDLEKVIGTERYQQILDTDPSMLNLDGFRD